MGISYKFPYKESLYNEIPTVICSQVHKAPEIYYIRALLGILEHVT
jgi:hypothetical protein